MGRAAAREPMSPDPDRSPRDALLLQRARSGDGGALAWLIASYQERLLTRIRLMMGPDARECVESGDVLQSVFSEAVHAFPENFPGDEQRFLRWLTKIARNHIVDEVRRRREESLEVLSTELRGEESSVTSHLSTEEAVQRLVEAIAELDEDRRQVVELRGLEKWRWKAIADALGRSEEAVRKLYHRTLLELGERLGADGREQQP